jgi:hypothetical protein
MEGDIAVICISEKQKYFFAQGWTREKDKREPYADLPDGLTEYDIFECADARDWSPRPALVRRSPPSGEGGCGERSDCEAIRVRGTLHESNLPKEPLTPPSKSELRSSRPREERGEGEEVAAATNRVRIEKEFTVRAQELQRLLGWSPTLGTRIHSWQ